MKETSIGLGNSTEEQELLRVVALWAADCAEQALPIFESHHPADTRPREAIDAGREFARGKKRDKNLRAVAWAAAKAGKEIDEPSKYAARAASQVAIIAYTHTDLQKGLQGVRQAKHILGPAVYTALALEGAANGNFEVGDDVIRRAAENATQQVCYLVNHMPPQPENNSRMSLLYAALDSALRNKDT